MKIFAYGSLINIQSLKTTVPGVGNIFPAKVFGFSRSFCLPSSYRFDSQTNEPVCVLNVKHSSSQASLNGICFEMDTNNFEALKEREKFYSLQEVDVHHYDDEIGSFSGYLFIAEYYAPYSFLSASPEQAHYLRLCIRGCEVYGLDFIEQFKKTTDFWGIEENTDVEEIWKGISTSNHN